MSILLTCSLLTDDTSGVLRCWIIESISESNSAIFSGISDVNRSSSRRNFVSQICQWQMEAVWQLSNRTYYQRCNKASNLPPLHERRANRDGDDPSIERECRMTYNAKKHESTCDFSESGIVKYLLTHRLIKCQLAYNVPKRFCHRPQRSIVLLLS